MLTAECYHVKLAGNVAADVDASAVASDAIDVGSLGTFDRIRVCVELGAVTDTGKIAVAVKCASTASGTYTAVASLAATDASDKDDNTIIIDCAIDDFVKIEYQRTVADIELDGIYYDLYDSDKVPVVQNTAVWKEIVA